MSEKSSEENKINPIGFVFAYTTKTSQAQDKKEAKTCYNQQQEFRHSNLLLLLFAKKFASLSAKAIMESLVNRTRNRISTNRAVSSSMP
jgi:hypothetical protein